MAGRRKITKRRRKRKRIVFVLELAVMAVLLAGLFAYHKLDLIDSQELDRDKIGVADIAQDQKKIFEGYTTIAMFGLDNRSAGNYESGNSDLIMIMNINNDTKEVNMVSVYRDTYLNTAAADENADFRKANAAYARGGAEQAITMLNRNLDLDIDNYIAFDFEAVAKTIDILEGVDIEITSEAELKYLNDYITHTNGILGTHSKTVDSVGVHTLDGVQAVAYARIRYTAGGDYKRAQRQRLVFSEMVKKAKKANLKQLNSLVNEIFPMIRTDLARNDIITMVSAMIGYDMGNSIGFPFDRSTIRLGSKGDVVVPCDLEGNVTELHRILFGEADYEPSSTVQDYSDEITNDTGYTKENAEKDDFSEKDSFNASDEADSESDSNSKEDGE